MMALSASSCKCYCAKTLKKYNYQWKREWYCTYCSTYYHKTIKDFYKCDQGKRCVFRQTTGDIKCNICLSCYKLMSLSDNNNFNNLSDFIFNKICKQIIYLSLVIF